MNGWKECRDGGDKAVIEDDSEDCNLRKQLSLLLDNRLAKFARNAKILMAIDLKPSNLNKMSEKKLLSHRKKLCHRKKRSTHLLTDDLNLEPFFRKKTRFSCENGFFAAYGIEFVQVPKRASLHQSYL